MEIFLANLDIILVAVVIVIAAIVFARRGQIDLIRELVMDIVGSVDASELYERLPKITKMLVSDKTVEKIVSENEKL